MSAAIVAVLLVLGASGCAASGAPEPRPTLSSVSTAGPTSEPNESTGIPEDDPAWALVVEQYPNAKRPTVSVVREVALSEWPIAFADCLTSSGFRSTPTPDGGTKTDAVPAAQEEAFAVAHYVCKKSYPLEAKYTTPLSQNQVAALYEYFTEQLTPCLRGQGVDVDEAPSLEVFSETLNTSSAWSPYLSIQVENLTLDQWNELSVTCPQFPEHVYDLG